MKIYSKFGRCVMLAKEAIHFNFLPPYVPPYALSNVIKGTWKYSCIHLVFLDAFPYLLHVTTQCRVSHSGGGAWGRQPPILRFFLTLLLPKPMPPMGCLLHLKMKLAPPPSETPPPPDWNMKHPYPLLIPRKSTINNNLKSS